MKVASLAVGVCLLTSHSLLAQMPANASAVDFFETKIRPVLAEHCYSCHGPKKQRGDIRVDGRPHLVQSREEGPLLVPGQPEKSRLMRAVRHEGEFKMPPKGKLPAEVIDNLAAWIRSGAVWPAEATQTAVKSSWRDHWAFQPVSRPELPAVKNQAWIASPVDRFVLARLESAGIMPNAQADRRTLLRRLKFDLLGLPPTREEADAFVRDSDPNAFEKVVDRYLASPQYGERWARHWLDVARYADNKGYVFQEERRYPYSYTYRDYVVKAFNEDLPYDRFVLEQIAADRLVASGKADVPSQAAMGFLTLGRRFLNNVHDIIDDRIDVVTRGLQGLTVQCARCHDHKFDPIGLREYYALYGVFASSVEPKDLPQIAEPEETPEYLAFRKKLDELESDVKKFMTEHRKELDQKNRDARNKLRALQQKVDSLKATSPAAPARAMVLQDAPRPVEPQVFLRGNPNNPGPVVPRQFLEVASVGPPIPLQDGSGRLDLARAIARRENPLTARVLVNRVWLHHFGKGLVLTPSDFGVRTEAPTHQALLDHLAARFMDEGWSIKKLHKWIVLSSTYQQSSAENAAASKIDPENRLLARSERRRLDFEGMRDALLFVSGRLDARMGGRSVDITGAKPAPRRTLYGFVDRQNLPGLFRTFDFASPDTTTPQRHETTVPQQALFLLNSPFLLDQARGLLNRPEVVAAEDVEDKIRALYDVVFARAADDDEIQLGESFVRAALEDSARPGQLTAWERYGQALLLANEFVFVD